MSITVAVKTLAAYLKAAIPELNIQEEWPDSKKELVMPTLSILTSGTPGLTHAMPIIHKIVPIDGDPIKKKVVYCVGTYESRLQLDLWTDYKAKRNELYEKLMAAFDKQFIDSGYPTGLSLELLNYHNSFARYDQTGYTYIDSEDSAKRNEWRVKIDVAVSHLRLVEKVESIMDEITLKSKIDETEVTDKDTNEQVTI